MEGQWTTKVNHKVSTELYFRKDWLCIDPDADGPGRTWTVMMMGEGKSLFGNRYRFRVVQLHQATAHFKS